MASFNKVILLGNLTRDPELRYTPTGTPVATFGMAMNRRSGQGDERKEEVCFVDTVVFGREAETASEYLSKGRQALRDPKIINHPKESTRRNNIYKPFAQIW